MHNVLLRQYKKIIKNYTIQDWKIEPRLMRLKMIIYFIDNSVLFVKETLVRNGSIRRYSYHWQSVTKKLIIRWDNAPDWNVSTFPHHKHIKKQDKVIASEEVSLEKVLIYILQIIGK